MRTGLLMSCLISAALVAAGCLEVQEILTSGWPEAPADYEYTGNPYDGADSNGVEEEEEDTPAGPAAPEIDTNGTEDTTDTDTNGTEDTDDADTNGADTSGVPPLPEDAELTTTESGLQYYDFEEGTGASPEATSTVRVDYVGYLEDGTIFDSNENTTFQLSRVVPGFSEGIIGMNVGGRRRLYIPPDLGYGENGNPNAGIGGEDTIIFDVTLLAIEEL